MVCLVCYTYTQSAGILVRPSIFLFVRVFLLFIQAVHSVIWVGVFFLSLSFILVCEILLGIIYASWVCDYVPPNRIFTTAYLSLNVFLANRGDKALAVFVIYFVHYLLRYAHNLYTLRLSQWFNYLQFCGHGLGMKWLVNNQPSFFYFLRYATSRNRLNTIRALA